jgi:hypothetical protein
MPKSINRKLAEVLVPSTTALKESVLDNISAGVTPYATLDDLPTSNLTLGDQAFVTSNQRLYLSNGSGWYNVAMFNATPNLTISPSGVITLATDGTTPTVITLTGTDSDNADANLIYSVESDGSFGGLGTLSQDSSVFTITPLAEGSATTTSSTLTFKVSDGISFGSGTTQFSLTFGPDYTSATESILRPSSNAAYDRFGSDVKINSDATYAIIGADRDTQGTGQNKGAAYVYTRSGSTWTEQAKLIASDTQYNDYFGCSVSISEDGMYAIAGAYQEDGGAGDPTSRAGAAYIYVRSGSSWSQQAKLIPSNVGANYDFGWAVSMSGDGTYVLVGAKADASTVSGGGAVYVFTRSGSTWTEQTKLEASDLQSNDTFGYDVEVNSDATYAIIASQLEDGGPGDPSGNVGAAYIFTRSGSTWTEQTRLNPSIPNGVGAGQTNSVSMNSDCSTVVLGSSYHNSSIATYTGAAYVFTRSGSTWTEQAVLEASDGGSDDAFGLTISMSSNGNYVAISAYGEDGGVGNPTSNSGAAYVFERDGSTWSQQAKLTASDAQAGDRFGSGIGISGDASYTIVGANEEDGGAGNPKIAAGAAYIYEA